MSRIIHGDSLEVLKTFEDNSVDLICTDPPYGYSFMGKDWDKAVPSVELWKECLRVLKPGGFAFVMSAPRSDVQMHMIQNLTDAGFRMDFTPIYWTFASGFPKAMNIGKAVDKRLGVERDVVGQNPNKRNAHNQGAMGFDKSLGGKKLETMNITSATSDEAKSLDGSYGGFQPKPAVEVILVAMKPLSEKTFVDQALKNGKGVTWLDDVRIPSSENMKTQTMPVIKGSNNFANRRGAERTEYIPNQSGRFPANLLVSDDVLNDGKITKSSDKPRINNRPKTEAYGTYKPDITGGHNDSGSYSRYFDLDKWAQTLPFLIVPKASKSEKDKGLEHLPEQQIVSMATANGTSGKPSSITEGRDTRRRNFHPTVKPLKLMSYLITLGSRKGDVVLDPFVGSGTTVLAAEVLDREGIGIERESEYVEVAEARLKAVDKSKQITLF